MDEKWYQEELLEYYRLPKNKRVLPSTDFSSQEYNPSCGDSVCMMGIIANNTITEIAFQGSGCVISQATASMLTEHCLNKSIDEVLQMSEKSITSLIGLTLGPVRIKCALLPLLVLQHGITCYRERIL